MRIARSKQAPRRQAARFTWQEGINMEKARRDVWEENVEACSSML
jgi:hypothetical protein